MEIIIEPRERIRFEPEESCERLINVSALKNEFVVLRGDLFQLLPIPPRPGTETEPRTLAELFSRLTLYFMCRIKEEAKRSGVVNVDLLIHYRNLQFVNPDIIKAYVPDLKFAIDYFTLSICLQEEEVLIMQHFFSLIKNYVNDEKVEKIVKELRTIMLDNCFRVMKIQRLIRLFQQLRDLLLDWVWGEAGKEETTSTGEEVENEESGEGEEGGEEE